MQKRLGLILETGLKYDIMLSMKKTLLGSCFRKTEL